MRADFHNKLNKKDGDRETIGIYLKLSCTVILTVRVRICMKVIGREFSRVLYIKQRLL